MVFCAFVSGAVGIIIAHVLGAPWLSFAAIGTEVATTGVCGILMTKVLQIQNETDRQLIDDIVQRAWNHLPIEIKETYIFGSLQ